MKVLAFASYGNSLEIGFRSPAGYFLNVRDIGLKHNQTLLPQIDGVLSEAGTTAAEVDLVVCTKGPGSFTALRILLSTAKGFAAGSGAGFIAVPTFDILGRLFSWSPYTVVPCLDGKKQKIYSAMYLGGKKIVTEADLPKEELAARILDHRPALVIGGSPRLFEDTLLYEDIRFVSAGFTLCETLIKIGEESFERDGSCDKLTEPLYIRKSDAELYGKPRK